MPESISYTCAVCGAAVNDADLEANPTLRRLVVNAQAFKAVSTPVGTTFVVSIEEDNPGDPLIFCGQAHAATWAQNWVW